MAKKSKNQKDREKLHAIFLESKGLKEPERRSNVSPDHTVPAGDTYDAQGRKIIVVDDDLVIGDLSTADLPPPRGHRDKNKDAQRIAECLEQKELRRTGAILDRMSPKDYEHIRTQAGVEVAFNEFSRLSKLVPILVISLDIEEIEIRGTREKRPALLQLSARVGNDKYTAVFQLWSKTKEFAIPHILDD